MGNGSWNNGPNPASPSTARISAQPHNNINLGGRRPLSKSPVAKNENEFVPETLTPASHSVKHAYLPPSSADKVKSSGRRIQPMSVPRKPPDIQNIALFPPIGDTPTATRTTFVAPKPLSSVPSSFGGRTKVNFKSLEPRLSDPFSPHDTNFGDCKSNPGSTTSALKLRQLENKISGKVTKLAPTSSKQTELLKSSENGSRNSSLKTPDQPRRVPRSAEIFAELTPEIITQVDKIAHQYSSILDKNWCRNVLEELNFLFQLISSCWDPAGNTKNSIPKKPLVNGHGSPSLPTAPQQIYFVIKVLNLQLDSALFSVDPRIIQLLVEKYPHRLPKPIRKHFESWAQAQKERTLALRSKNPEQSTQKPSEFHQCVTFRSDDDGRSNFPSQGDFHSFCKQRDLFYAIKTSWTTKQKEGTGFKEPENGRIAPVSGRFSGGGGNGRVNLPLGRELDPLYPKIKALFNMNSSWANLSHLASLFSSQFIMDSFEKTESTVTVGGTGDDEGIKSFFGSNNLNRLTQLQNRMSSAASSDRQNDDLSFVRYFLSIANSPEFNQHLVDRVIHEIYEIESYVESSSGSAELKELELCLQKTVILSKLLGYLAFLPYKNEGPHNRGGLTASLDKEALISKQLQLRAHQKPPIDIRSKLLLAYNQRRLTLTLPWVVELLTSADRVSLELPAYQEPIRILDYLYHNYLSVNQEQSPNPVILSNSNFMRFWCGKLFSLDIFPHKLYSKGDPKIDNIFKSTDQFSLDQTLTCLDKRKRSFVDSCGYFGDRLSSLYFADQFKKMSDTLHLGLQQHKLGAASTFDTAPNGPEVKHIRPVPARSPVKPVILSSSVQLEMQLESSFFDSKSPSVKKTVDFVAERIASNFVKKLRVSMPDIRSQLAIQGTFEEGAVSLCKKEMLSELKEFSKESSLKAMGVLIGDLSSAALNVCVEITSRKCFERVAEWVYTHVNAEMFPIVEIPPDSSISTPVGKPVLNLSGMPPTTTDSKTNQPSPETAWKPIFDIIILLHRCVKGLHQRRSVSEENIDLILDCSPLSACSGLGTTLTDFGLTLVIFWPHLLSAERLAKLVELIRPQWNYEGRGILCGRNLQFLYKEARSNEQSWTKFTELLVCLTNAELMSLESVDCMALLRQDWEPELSHRISYILKEMVTSTKSSNSRASQASREVLDWVAWVCGDNPDEDF